jgi:hypothetical protein
LWRWKVYWLLLSAALSHGLFAEARTIPLSVDQICFRRAMKAMGTTASIRDFSRQASLGGGERILAVLGSSSVVGELSMIDGVPRSASEAATAAAIAKETALSN